jgi:hypothetical protein
MVNVSFDRVNLPFRTDFFVGGVRCQLSTNSYHVLQHSIPWRTASRDGDVGTFDLDVFEDPSMDSGASGTHFRGLRHLVFAMLEPRTFVSYDLLRRQVRGVVSSEAARDRAFWKSQLLPMTIGILGTTMGVAPLHCACLTRNGNGLLVAGLSGAGKSTLTAALAKRGFGVVSDDWTYISRKHGGLVADGLSAPIKLLPDSARFFPELRTCIRNRSRTVSSGGCAYLVHPEMDIFSRTDGNARLPLRSQHERVHQRVLQEQCRTLARRITRSARGEVRDHRSAFRIAIVGASIRR